MAFGNLTFGCDCCQECVLYYNAFTCAGTGAYNTWGNLLPPSLITPSALAVWIAPCGNTNISGAVSEVFYPFADPSQTGMHTFNFQPGNKCLTTQYNTGIFSVAGNGINQYDITFCSGSMPLALYPLRDYTIYYPCIFKTLQPDGSVTHKFVYNRDYQYSMLALYNNVMPTTIDEVCLTSFSCVQLYDWPSSTGQVQGSCAYNVTQSNDSSCCGNPNPAGSNYYKTITNNRNVTFTVQRPTTVSINGFPESLYISDVQLLYSYVVYQPKGTPAINWPYSSTYGLTMCSLSGTAPCQVWDQNYASIFFQYAAIIHQDISDITTCVLPNIAINEVKTDYFYPQTNTCGSVYNYILGQNVPCQWVGFCGDNAFNDAENFCRNLPQTFQYGQYSSYFGTEFSLSNPEMPISNGTIETFPQTASTGCPPVWTTTNVAIGSNYNIIYSGINTLTLLT